MVKIINMDKSDIKILTYNSTGFATDKQQFIAGQISLHDPDIVFIQETWLLESNRSVSLRSLHCDYLADGISSVRKDQLLSGRPHGGLGILWRKDMSANVKFKSIDNTNRACAIELNTDNGHLVLINVYMPVDNQRKSHVDEEFLRTMDAIESFVESCGNTKVIIAGDLNVDFSRKNAHDIYIGDFMERYGFTDSFELPVADNGYTYIDLENGCRSCIDHILVRNMLCNSVLKVARSEDALNPSKHIPVIMELFAGHQVCQIIEENQENSTPMISWNRVNEMHIEMYQREQCRNLNTMMTYDVMNCHDVMCQNIEHKHQIDQLCACLIQNCLKSDHVFPKVSKVMGRPDWKYDVKPFRDEAIWWHSLWIQIGRPRDGPVFQSMRESKRQYMYANRRNKRNVKQKRIEKMAEAIVEDKSRDFFKEVKKFHPKDTKAPMIDNHIDSKEIADVFAQKYHELYNSVPSDAGDMQRINHHISQNITTSNGLNFVVTSKEVDKAIKLLKYKKADGDHGLMSDHIIYSHPRFREFIGKMVTAIIVHGHMPRDLLLGTIVSIPKDNRASLITSSNYRGITLCSALSKLIDVIIILRYSDILLTSDMQYAFKDNHSTTMCSLTLKEVITYYLNNKSEVYTCFVDASKAFDKVRHDQLFNVLIDRGMPPVILRMMMDMYKRQSLRTVWGNSKSTPFVTSNGIRQGGVMSPLLFCIYMDVLLLELERVGIGCRIGRHFYGALCYADDITLCAPSVSGLRQMLKLCEEFGDKFSVTYNPLKTVCVLFSRRRKLVYPDVHLKGTLLQWKDEVKHLGNYFESSLRETKEVRMKKSDVIQRTNSVVVNLGKSKVEIVRKVFNSQCSHFYGTEAWRFSDSAVKEFQTCWNRCIRRAFHLPCTTHRRFLPQLLESAMALRQIYARFLKLLTKMMGSKNERVSFLARMSVRDSCSVIGSNINVIKKELNCDNLPEDAQRLLKCVDYSDCGLISVIKDMCDVRSGCAFIQGFYENELDFITNFICTY